AIVRLSICQEERCGAESVGNGGFRADDPEFDLPGRDQKLVSEHAGQSSAEPQRQIPRIRVGALDTVTNTRIYESQYKVSGTAGKLAPYSQRPPSLPKPVFLTHSTISDESLPRHRSSTPTPEPTVVSTVELVQTVIAPHVKLVFSPMRRSTKRSIGLDEAADDSIGEQGGEADGQLYGDVVMDDSDAEMEMGLDMSAKERCHPLRKKDEIPESTTTRTLLAKRTKYVPRPASTSVTSTSSTTMTTSKITSTKARIRSGAGGGKTIGASHLTQLRETHRRLGIAKTERAVVSSASGSSVGKTASISTSERRVRVPPSSRSVSGSLQQKHTQAAAGKEIGPSRTGSASVLEKEHEKKPWVDVRTTEAIDSRPCGATPATHLTKPVPFTFRADARARRTVTDPCISGFGANDSGGGGGAGENDKGRNRGDGGLRKMMLLESDHGESGLHCREERVPLTTTILTSSPNTAILAVTTAAMSTTVPCPFTFTTALCATECAKFDALTHQKQEEMARAREEARKQAKEEMARVVREMRRRAVPKAHEVPEWYKEMPKKGQGMG
ncbi:hypothetical protein BKA83DRAFT_4323125, partial [Pisolithus microcarpus]